MFLRQWYPHVDEQYRNGSVTYYTLHYSRYCHMRNMRVCWKWSGNADNRRDFMVTGGRSEAVS